MRIKSPSHRIIVNIVVQYVRSVISLFVNLYSTRLILDSLGVDDYGIYSLTAGVVSLLSFFGNSLAVTTQRFMSFHQTRSPVEIQTRLFSNSIVIHLCITALLFVVLECLSPFLFNGFLNIEQSRVGSARNVYQFVVIMAALSLMSAPYKALLIAHENITYISIVEIADSFIKLGIAFWITFHGTDKLVLYASLLTIISAFQFMAFAIYDYLCYKECRVPRRSHLDRKLIREMSGFAGWTLWSQGCFIGRQQGISIVINKIFGTVANAAYGIGIQINNAIIFVSSSLANAFTPQIVKTAGEDDRDRMFLLASAYSKFAFLMLAAVAVPLFIHCPLVLSIWLGKIPAYATIFCRICLATSLVDLLTIGLGTANQALGDIMAYSIWLNTMKLATVPAIIILLICGSGLGTAMMAYPVIELSVALLRLPFLKRTAGLDIRKYITGVFVPVAFPMSAIIAFYSISTLFVNDFLELLLVVLVGSAAYGTLVFLCSLGTKEKSIIKAAISRIKPHKSA